jgi:hypothetical protein
MTVGEHGRGEEGAKNPAEVWRRYEPRVQALMHALDNLQML